MGGIVSSRKSPASAAENIRELHHGEGVTLISYGIGPKTLPDGTMLLHKFAAGLLDTSPNAHRNSNAWLEGNKTTLNMILRLPDADLEGCLNDKDMCNHFNSSAEEEGDLNTVSGSVCTHGGRMFPHVTPLMQAILHGNLLAVEMLLETGADVNATVANDIHTGYSVIPKGATVLMLALSRIFAVLDSEVDSEALDAGSAEVRNNKSEDLHRLGVGGALTLAMICNVLLDIAIIDVEGGCTDATGEYASAVTIAGALLEVSRSFHFPHVKNSSENKLLCEVSERVLNRALSKALSGRARTPPRVVQTVRTREDAADTPQSNSACYRDRERGIGIGRGRGGRPRRGRRSTCSIVDRDRDIRAAQYTNILPGQANAGVPQG
jgi:Ankyrin repeat